MKNATRFFNNLKYLSRPNAWLIVFVFIFFTLFSFVLFSSPETALAQQTDTFGIEQVDDSVALGSQDIRITIAKIIRTFLGFLAIIAVSLVLYAGFTIMTAGGNEEKVTEGKKILINAGIGLAIIMSSFAITQFVLNKLAAATGIRTGQEEGALVEPGSPDFQSYAASGSLGSIIKDHYPDRDQIEVFRNTKIAVTFREAIDPSSFVDNKNKTCWNTGKGDVAVSCDDKNTEDYFGDCVGDNCDVLKTDVIEIYQKEDKGKTKVKAAVSLQYTDKKEVFGFVLDPIDPDLLGNEKENTWYVVDINNTLKKLQKDQKGNAIGVFDNELYSHYEWEFQTNVNADFAPPVVSMVYPPANATIARNDVIQIHFSEPIDPSVGQGVLKDGGAFKHIIFNNKKISGEWKIVNGYKTIEFVPSQECGENSCGDKLYCLPVICPAGKACDKAPYEVLARTAELKDPNKKDIFDAKAFSGLMDMAGNALDGNKDKKADNKPAVKNVYEIDASEKKADNFSWNFTVADEIDLTAPYITKVTPALDGQSIPKQAPLTITFSRPMIFDSLYGGVNIKETPKASGDVDKLWFVPRAELTAKGETKVTFKHRDFGPNGQDLFYYVSISSDARSGQNCLYPGRGPFGSKKGDTASCTYEEDKNGKVTKNQGCISVDFAAKTDTGCALTDGKQGEEKQENITKCAELLDSKIPK